MNKRELYRRVVAWFTQTMPEAGPELRFSSEFELLVAVVLSAQCTDRRVNMVTPRLFARFPSPEALASAEVDEVVRLISSVSYPNAKGAHLVGMARMLADEFGGRVPSTREALMRLPGVGRKTANVILSVCFGQGAMAVDTHVFRVSHRLGLVSPEASTPLAVELELTKHIPKRLLCRANHWLILHGRYVCRSRKPLCAQCGLSPVCRSSAIKGKASDK